MLRFSLVKTGILMVAILANGLVACDSRDEMTGRVCSEWQVREVELREEGKTETVSAGSGWEPFGVAAEVVGGMGHTWTVPPRLFLRRCARWEPVSPGAGL